MEKPSLLVAGCERKPGLPNLNYIPPGGIPYKVSTGEDWWKLAAKPEVKSAGVDALGLCEFNFKTRVPAEINWYLRNKVGCVRATVDKKNYVFTSDANPGIVYLPPPATASKVQINSWVGLGFKFGSTVIVAGIEQMGGAIISIQDLVNTEPKIRTVALNAETTRLGLGVGASGGLCLIYVTSLRHPHALNGYMSGGGDFNLALGGNAGSLIKGGKSAAKLKKLKPLVDALIKINARTPEALKKALSQPDKLGDLYKAVTALKDTLQNEPDEVDPNVIVVDLPVSGGTELSVFHGVTNFRVLGQPEIEVNWSEAQ
jgi:hypothetical protein